jgi:hypothetical protein
MAKPSRHRQTTVQIKQRNLSKRSSSYLSWLGVPVAEWRTFRFKKMFLMSGISTTYQGGLNQLSS